jgi:hypothetical protein
LENFPDDGLHSDNLVAKRAELAGEIKRTHERLRELVKALGHIDGTSRIVAPDMEVQAMERLAVIGVKDTEPNIRNKLARANHCRVPYPVPGRYRLQIASAGAPLIDPAAHYRV